jgi:hypothetical protein
VKNNIEVFVNDRKISIYRGMQVKHALIAYDQDVYKAAQEGYARIEDENGFIVGLEGGLTEGARIYVKTKFG